MSITLVTGADGHVGAALSHWLIDNTDHKLVLCVRADDDAELAAKRLKLGSLAGNNRCRVIAADLRDPQPFANIGVDGVTGILHCSAVTSFAVDQQTAQAVNVDGTEKLIEFATRCQNLRRFGFVGTLYAAGLREGVIPESTLDEAEQFANHYEWSKWHAEKLLVGTPNLPWQIYRMATILGEDSNGLVVQQNAIHNTLRLLYYGLLSVVPGDPDTRVYTTTTEFAAAAIGRLFLDADDQGVFHISDSGNEAITLGAMIDSVYESFIADPRFAKQRILKPLFCDREAFETLVEGSSQFGGAIAQSLQSLAPFAPQLYSDKDIQTQHATESLNGLRSPESATLLRAVCDHLVETRWGLRPARQGAGQ
jgi:nucleoside-diphosphate-sugar epimerase